jgi:hypothetical protein
LPAFEDRASSVGFNEKILRARWTDQFATMGGGEEIGSFGDQVFDGGMCKEDWSRRST